MTGLLIIDKPKGWTSHDVVAKIKGKLRAKKAGHLGTLDPLATGLLLIALDRATKFASFLDAGYKEYYAAMKLGEETDTYDSEGSLVKAGDAGPVREDDIKRVLDSFRGTIMQVPPMYSAIKKDGTPLYKLARRGVTIEREARQVEIREIEAIRVEPPNVEFRVVASKGTYVRSICHDAGRMLGCGAHMTTLRRTKSGPFSVEGALNPGSEKEELEKRVIPLMEALKLTGAPLEAIEKASRLDTSKN